MDEVPLPVPGSQGGVRRKKVQKPSAGHPEQADRLSRIGLGDINKRESSLRSGLYCSPARSRTASLIIDTNAPGAGHERRGRRARLRISPPAQLPGQGQGWGPRPGSPTTASRALARPCGTLSLRSVALDSVSAPERPKAGEEPTASAKTVSSPVGERGGDKDAVGNAWRSRSAGMPAGPEHNYGRGQRQPEALPATKGRFPGGRPARPSPSRTAPGGTRTTRCRGGLADGRTPTPGRASPPIRRARPPGFRTGSLHPKRRGAAPRGRWPPARRPHLFSRDTQKMPPRVGTRMPSSCVIKCGTE
jgi:hypothetical protein